MTGYVRQDTSNNIADGNIINAADLDSEFDGLQAAFNASTGHVHDGTTGNGAPILVVGPTQDVVFGTTSVTPKTTNTVDIGSSSLKFKDIFITGTATLPTVSATTGNITTVNATTVDTTNIEVTTLKAKDGTAAGSIADSTGVVTLASSVLTTADINGGTLDNVVIGGSTAAAASVTTLTTSSTVTLNGGTANGVAYLNGSKVLTTGTNLTYGTGGGAYGLVAVAGGVSAIDLKSGGGNATQRFISSSGTSWHEIVGTSAGWSFTNKNQTGTISFITTATGGATTQNLLMDSNGITQGATAFTANPALGAGTANGVAYLNGSKVLTTGSALTFDGTALRTTTGFVAASTVSAVMVGGSSRASFYGSGNSSGGVQVDSSGYVFTPAQPCFYATGSNTGASGFQVFGTVQLNTANAYNNANGRFTAPVGGTYQFSTFGFSSSGYTAISLYKNGATDLGDVYVNSPSAGTSGSLSINVYLNAGDYVQVFCNADALYSGSLSGFSGMLIG